tara:strand:- start:456 stop:602 length:147 start_codon:yes stop_codon:yes gene_type:complete
MNTYKIVFSDEIEAENEDEAREILLSVLQEKVNSEDLSCFDISLTERI